MTDPVADYSMPDALMRSTAGIVAAYVRHNPVAVGDLRRVTIEVHTALARLLDPPEPEVPEPLVPAVPVRRSITPEALVCLDCGRSFRMLRRHLMTEHGLTPAQYRDRWQLKPDYPVTAPAYAERRAELAKAIGLGRSKPPAPAPARRRTKR